LGVASKAKSQDAPEICEGITQNLVEIGKFYLNSSTKLREASSKFISNFFARPDI